MELQVTRLTSQRPEVQDGICELETTFVATFFNGIHLTDTSSCVCGQHLFRWLGRAL